MTSHYPTATTPIGLQAEELYQQGYQTYLQQQFGDARLLMERSLALFSQAQHQPGILRALHILANIAYEEQRYATARTLHEKILVACREINFEQGIASSLNNLGLVAGKQRQFVEGCTLLEESIRIYQNLGHAQEAAAAQVNLEALRRQQATQLEERAPGNSQ